jgi:hypothetical protein
MPDELDAKVLRHFAQARQPLAELPFVTQLSTRLSLTPGPRLRITGLWSVPGAILGGLVTGVSASLRVRHVGLMAVAGAAVALWATFA